MEATEPMPPANPGGAFIQPHGLLRLLPILPWLNRTRLKSLRIHSVLACLVITVLAFYEVLQSYRDGDGTIAFVPLMLAAACLSKILDPVSSLGRSQSIGAAALDYPEVQQHLNAAFSARRGLCELDYAVIRQYVRRHPLP